MGLRKSLELSSGSRVEGLSECRDRCFTGASDPSLSLNSPSPYFCETDLCLLLSSQRCLVSQGRILAIIFNSFFLPQEEVPSPHPIPTWLLLTRSLQCLSLSSHPSAPSLQPSPLWYLPCCHLISPAFPSQVIFPKHKSHLVSLLCKEICKYLPLSTTAPPDWASSLFLASSFSCTFHIPSMI